MSKQMPKKVLEAAQRIAANSGISVDVVISRFRKAARKTTLTASDFFCGVSDISLSKNDRPLVWK